MLKVLIDDNLSNKQMVSTTAGKYSQLFAKVLQTQMKYMRNYRKVPVFPPACMGLVLLQNVLWCFCYSTYQQNFLLPLVLIWIGQAFWKTGISLDQDCFKRDFGELIKSVWPQAKICGHGFFFSWMFFCIWVCETIIHKFQHFISHLPSKYWLLSHIPLPCWPCWI